jgi:hypothetical protein
MRTELQKIVEKYNHDKHVEATRRGVARAKKRKLIEKLMELVDDAEYDIEWRFLQNYYNNLSEEELLEHIEIVESTQGSEE